MYVLLLLVSSAVGNRQSKSQRDQGQQDVDRV